MQLVANPTHTPSEQVKEFYRSWLTAACSYGPSCGGRSCSAFVDKMLHCADTTSLAHHPAVQLVRTTFARMGMELTDRSAVLVTHLCQGYNRAKVFAHICRVRIGYEYQGLVDVQALDSAFCGLYPTIGFLDLMWEEQCPLIPEHRPLLDTLSFP